jgi:hypothetical protein
MRNLIATLARLAILAAAVSAVYDAYRRRELSDPLSDTRAEAGHLDLDAEWAAFNEEHTP